MKNLIASNDFMKLYKLEDESLVLVTKEESQDEDNDLYDIVIRFEHTSELNISVGINYKDEEKRDSIFADLTYEIVAQTVNRLREKMRSK